MQDTPNDLAKDNISYVQLLINFGKLRWYANLSVSLRYCFKICMFPTVRMVAKQRCPVVQELVSRTCTPSWAGEDCAFVLAGQCEIGLNSLLFPWFWELQMLSNWRSGITLWIGGSGRVGVSSSLKVSSNDHKYWHICKSTSNGCFILEVFV